MAALIYTGITSLDGFISDETGNFDWSAPDEEVHAFVNRIERPIGTYLVGRRLYEIMSVWETMPTEGEPAVVADYAHIWRSADKIVFSTTLGVVSSTRTLVERRFDPAAIGRLKAVSSKDISVGGSNLAAQALAAGLVDRVRQFLSPVIVGGGTRFLPEKVALELDLVDEFRFSNGVVYLDYRVRGAR